MTSSYIQMAGNKIGLRSHRRACMVANRGHRDEVLEHTTSTSSAASHAALFRIEQRTIPCSLYC